jgi:hypothetical protein
LKITRLAASAAVALTLTACALPGETNEGALRPAMEKFLAERGDLCLGKHDWPIEVSERDASIGARDAVQMPVLEKAGIVSSSRAFSKRNEFGTERELPVTRYDLTETGRKYYIARETTQVSADGRKTVHAGDFCAGKLSLDSIVAWDAPKTVGDHLETTVSYTYHIDAAPWAKDPEVQKVFPMVGRIVKGEGSMQLKQALRLTRRGWVAINPWE